MNTTKSLKPGMVVKTSYGEWVLIIRMFKTMAVVDSIGKYEHRGMVHISKMLPSTAHMLTNPQKWEYR